MAQWSGNKVDPSNINGGIEYKSGDRLSREAVNSIVNNSIYASKKSDEALEKADSAFTANGTIARVNGIPQTFLDFESDPQEQLNQIVSEFRKSWAKADFQAFSSISVSKWSTYGLKAEVGSLKGTDYNNDFTVNFDNDSAITINKDGVYSISALLYIADFVESSGLFITISKADGTDHSYRSQVNTNTGYRNLTMLYNMLNAVELNAGDVVGFWIYTDYNGTLSVQEAATREFCIRRVG